MLSHFTILDKAVLTLHIEVEHKFAETKRDKCICRYH